MPVELGSGLCQAWLNEGVRNETLGEAGWAGAQIREPPGGTHPDTTQELEAGWPGAQTDWCLNPGGNVGQGLNLSEPQFPRLQNGTGHAYVVKL